MTDLQVDEERMCAIPIDLNLPGERELSNKRVATLHARPDILHPIQDLCGIGPWLLLSKLITGECQDLKGLILVLLSKGVQCVVLGGETSERGHIDDQEDFALVVRDADVLCSFNIFSHEVVGAVDVGGFLAVALLEEHLLVLFQLALGQGQGHQDRKGLELPSHALGLVF